MADDEFEVDLRDPTDFRPILADFAQGRADLERTLARCWEAVKIEKGKYGKQQYKLGYECGVVDGRRSFLNDSSDVPFE